MAKVRLTLGFALTVVFLYLALRNIGWTQVMEALGRANYVYVIPAALLTIMGYLLRTMRWKHILSPVHQVGFARLLPVLIVGFAANNVLPARAGEFIRAYSIGRREGMSKTLALATIMLERISDGLTLLLFLSVVLLLFPAGGAGAEVRIMAWLSLIVFAGSLIALLILRRFPQRAEQIISWLSLPLPQSLRTAVERMAGNFILGLEVLARRGDMLIIALQSVLIWTCEAGSYLLIMQAFDLPFSLPQQALASVFVLVFVNLGIMLPSAPGYVGTFQFFARLALEAFGVAGGVGFAFAAVSHGMQYVLITSLGLVMFLREGLTLCPVSTEMMELAASPLRNKE